MTTRLRHTAPRTPTNMTLVTTSARTPTTTSTLTLDLPIPQAMITHSELVTNLVPLLPQDLTIEMIGLILKVFLPIRKETGHIRKKGTAVMKAAEGAGRGAGL